MSTIKSSAENLTLNADGANNDIKFQSNGVEKASIDQDGNLVLSGTLTSVGVDDNCTATKLTVSDSGININGDITFSSASQGICLGVTSNTDANTLDDYEEGTWTPDFRGTSGSVGSAATNATKFGKYTKVGNLVTIVVQGYFTNLGSWSGNFEVQGLPFAAGTPSSGSIKQFPSTEVDAAFRTFGVGQDHTVLSFFKGSRMDVRVPFSEIGTSYYLSATMTYMTA